MKEGLGIRCTSERIAAIVANFPFKDGWQPLENFIYKRVAKEANASFPRMAKGSTSHVLRQKNCVVSIRIPMEGAEFQKHLDEMHKHEGIFWETGDENDEIKRRLNAIQARLEAAVAPCFKEPMSLYTLLTRRWQ